MRHEGIFEEINRLMIWKMALKTQGAAGPSGLNADHVRNLLSKRIFGEVAMDLRKALASLAKKMAMEKCKDIEALIARRLIPLDKNPGVRPIAIGEDFTRIQGKCIMAVTREDVKLAAGNLQVCVGHRAGGEATIHAMKEIFNDKEVEAAMLVDATNAFNSINREAMLHNIAVKCPEINRYVQNWYGKPSKLFIVDGKQNGDKCILYSKEGTAQGEPVAMAMYALGLSVLHLELKHEETNVKSVAYADDYVGAGNLQDLSKWWDNLTERGPCYRCYPNAVKSLLIVKPEKENVAKELFNGTNIRITSTGAYHLGATVGSEEFEEEYVKMKVEEMTMELKKLS